MRRRKSRRPELHVEDVDVCEPRPCSIDCPEKGVEDLELRAAIFDGLHRLSDDHRVVLVLREFSGLNYEQIAELEGCPKGTVMSRLFHARRQLVNCSVVTSTSVARVGRVTEEPSFECRLAMPSSPASARRSHRRHSPRVRPLSHPNSAGIWRAVGAAPR